MSGEGEVPDETGFVADSVDEFVERERHRQLLGAKEDAAASFRRAAELRIDTSVGQDDIRDLVREQSHRAPRREDVDLGLVPQRTARLGPIE